MDGFRPYLIADLGDVLTIIIFLVIFLGSGIVQMIKKLRGIPDEDEENQPPPVRRAPPSQRPAPPPQPWSAEADEVRKFLEALGKPKDAAPPSRPPPAPPVLRPVEQQRPPPPPPPRRQARPHPLQPSPAPARPVRPPPVVLEEVETPWLDKEGMSLRTEAPAFERINVEAEMEAVKRDMARAQSLTAAPVVVTTVQNRATSLSQLLADRSSARNAIVLAEILGPPKSERDEANRWDV